MGLIPELLPAACQRFPGGRAVLTSADAVINWGRKSSLWPLTFGLACCAIEMMVAYAGRFDLDRLGVFPRPSPRHADVLIIAGTVTKKMAASIVRLYRQMPEPRFVIAMGSCANCGGPYHDSYAVVKGVDKLIPVDVYIAGCPPRPEAMIYALEKLQEKMSRMSLRHGAGAAPQHEKGSRDIAAPPRGRGEAA